MPALVVLLAFAWLHYATADETANCTVSSDSWMDNAFGQNPCRVAEFLSYPCNAWTVTPLSNGSQWYTGVSDNTCDCNTVMYNLLSACSMCQGGSQQGWQTYSQNCSLKYVGQYPEEILSTTSVPHWAYIDISDTNLLNLSQAEAVGDSPETTGGLISTATVTATRITRVTATASGTNGKGPSIVGPIVGGVVGGVAFVVLVAAVGFYFITRREEPQIQMLPKPSVLASPSTVPRSSVLFTGASSSTRQTTGQGGKSFEAYEPHTQYSTLSPSRFPNPHNNAVAMYVTPSNAYIHESGRNSMYRTT
ncbi:hypothetical protein AX14_006592 [Amanita brunnescens Koide BX004]|nr:hypothetical protein AX14_006592 [Amanita brunnescens Koide BX004]